MAQENKKMVCGNIDSRELFQIIKEHIHAGWHITDARIIDGGIELYFKRKAPLPVGAINSCRYASEETVTI